MVINEIEFALKNEERAVIRSPGDADIQGMLDFLCLTSGETEYLLRYPEECGKYTPEGEKDLIDRINASDNEAMIVCVANGRVVACCQITCYNRIKTRHRAGIAIAVIKKYWGQGIGTRLMQELIRIATDNINITQVELEYIEGNTRARSLYEKFGFVVTGVRPDAIRLKDGTLLNEYTMVRRIDR